MADPKPKPENLLVNLACNLAIPTLVLTKLSGANALGPAWGLVVALSFPLGYGVHDFIRRRRANFISIIGCASVLVSGSMGLLHVGPRGFAIKEAAVPLLIGIGVLVSLRSKTPIVRELLFNEQIVDVPRVDAALDARGSRAAFESLLGRISYWLAGAFVVSSALNYFLARLLLKSPAGTTEFNAELGKMHWVSVFVISVPFMVAMMLVFWRLIRGLHQLTGLTNEEIFRDDRAKK